MDEEERDEKIDALSIRLEDNEEKTSEMEKDVLETKIKVKKIADDKDIKLFLSDLSFPIGLKQFIINSVPRVISRSLARFFSTEKSPTAIIQSKMGIIVKYIANDIMKNEGLLQTQATIIRSGLEYLNFTDSASWLTKPMLMYYGVMQVLSGIIGCFYSFQRAPSALPQPGMRQVSFDHHGIQWGKGDGWNVVFCPGFFEKLVVCVNLNLYPNIFSCKNYIERKKLNLPLLSKNIDSPQTSESDRFLIQYLCLYLFNSRARYDPANWNDFLRGRDDMYRIMVETDRSILSNLIKFIKNIAKSTHLFYE